MVRRSAFVERFFFKIILTMLIDFSPHKRLITGFIKNLRLEENDILADFYFFDAGKVDFTLILNQTSKKYKNILLLLKLANFILEPSLKKEVIYFIVEKKAEKDYHNLIVTDFITRYDFFN